MDKVIILLDKDDSISDSKVFLSKLVSMGIYNFTKEKDDLMYLYDNPNTYRDVAQYQELDTSEPNNVSASDISQYNTTKKILGVKNVTDSAGSTTLIYMLKKVLKDYYNVMALELNKRDFIYFTDTDMLSIKEDELDKTMSKYSSTDIFIVDLNKSSKEYVCTDVIYLVEPSTIKVNKLLLINKGAFKDLQSKNIVLNKSLFNNKEVSKFEIDTNSKVYYNIPPLDEKKDNSEVLLPLLEKLGYIKSIEKESQSNKKSIFNLFK